MLSRVPTGAYRALSPVRRHPPGAMSHLKVRLFRLLRSLLRVATTHNLFMQARHLLLHRLRLLYRLASVHLVGRTRKASGNRQVVLRPRAEGRHKNEALRNSVRRRDCRSVVRIVTRNCLVRAVVCDGLRRHLTTIPYARRAANLTKVNKFVGKAIGSVRFSTVLDARVLRVEAINLMEGIVRSSVHHLCLSVQLVSTNALDRRTRRFRKVLSTTRNGRGPIAVLRGIVVRTSFVRSLWGLLFYFRRVVLCGYDHA